MLRRFNRLLVVCYIAATSMGAIVGGLYASGMKSDAMEARLANLDWSKMFSDSPPRRDLDTRRKDENARYPIAFEMGFGEGHGSSGVVVC